MAGCRRFEAGSVVLIVDAGAKAAKIERRSVLRHPELDGIFREVCVRTASAVGPAATGIPGLLVRTGVRAPFPVPSIRVTDFEGPGFDVRMLGRWSLVPSILWEGEYSRIQADIATSDGWRRSDTVGHELKDWIARATCKPLQAVWLAVSDSVNATGINEIIFFYDVVVDCSWLGEPAILEAALGNSESHGAHFSEHRTHVLSDGQADPESQHRAHVLQDGCISVDLYYRRGRTRRDSMAWECGVT